MSVLALVLIVLGALFVVLLLGGLVVSRRRLDAPDYAEHVLAADHALEAARAEDRGWDRVLLEEAARAALEAERPDWGYDELHLVLVDDRPGVEEDRAHLVAIGDGEETRVVLTRDPGGAWTRESVG